MNAEQHFISLELSYGMIFCAICNDFIYDETCQTLAETHLRKEAL